ncbi:MAG TPA: YqhA family protein [Acetobacteraceae bacterium]|nr:YqhA family protein [Acetobacteraceae bacterium]
MALPLPSRRLGQVMFAGRWLLAPIYAGLLVALFLVVVEVLFILVKTIPGLLEMSVSAFLLFALKLIDLSFIANLLLMVTVGSWHDFVLPLLPGQEEDRPEGLRHFGFSLLKLKVISSVAMIAAISLLETYLTSDETTLAAILPGVVVLLAFCLAGLLLAWTDRAPAAHAAPAHPGAPPAG